MYVGTYWPSPLPGPFGRTCHGVAIFKEAVHMAQVAVAAMDNYANNPIVRSTRRLFSPLMRIRIRISIPWKRKPFHNHQTLHSYHHHQCNKTIKSAANNTDIPSYPTLPYPQAMSNPPKRIPTNGPSSVEPFERTPTSASRRIRSMYAPAPER